MMFLVLLLLLPQDVEDLVEKLRSGTLEERAESAQRLEELGTKALPALRKAGDDPEAKRLIARIELRAALPSELILAVPDLLDRLCRGEWVGAFLDCLRDLETEPRAYPKLTRELMAPLARGAVRNAKQGKERSTILLNVGTLRFKDCVPEICELLRNDDLETRVLACRTLGELRAREAAPAILLALEDEEDRVRYEAVQVVRLLRLRSALPVLVRLLSKEGDGARYLAAMAVAEFGSKEAVPTLLEMLATRHASNRLPALDKLAELGATEAVSKILPLLEDDTPLLRAMAAETLGTLSPGESKAAIAPLLTDSDPGVRERAARAIGKSGDLRYAPNLERLLSDELPVRIQAVLALGHIRANEYAPAIAKLAGFNQQLDFAIIDAMLRMDARDQAPVLVRLLAEGYSETSERAARALVRLDARREVRAIRNVLRTSSKHSRIYACRVAARLDLAEAAPDILLLIETEPFLVEFSLGLLRARSAVPGLIELLKSSSDGVRQAAVNALGRMRAAEAWRDVVPLLDDQSASVADAAARTLGLLGERRAIPELIARIKGWRTFLLNGLYSALSSLHATEALPKLVDLREVLAIEKLQDPACVQLLIQRADDERFLGLLADLGAADAYPIFLKALADPKLRVQAARGLGHIGNRTAIPDLLAYLGAGNMHVIEALMRLNAREAVPDLVRIVQDPKTPNRFWAASALLELGDREDWERVANVESKDTVSVWALQKLRTGGPRIREFLETEPLTAASALRFCPDPNAAQELRVLLNHRISSTADAAIEALGYCGTRDDIPALLEEVRCGRSLLPAARAAHRLGARRELLVTLMKTLPTDHHVRAGQAIAVLFGLEAQPDLLRALDTDDPALRSAAIRVLVDIGAVDSIDQIIQSATDRDADVSEKMAVAIETLGVRKRADAVLQLLRHPSNLVRIAAFRASATLQIRDAIPMLIDALDDPSTCGAAMEALGQMGVREAIPEIRSRAWESPKSAALAFGALGDREAIPLLRRMLRIEDSRAEAAEALGVLQAREAAADLIAVLPVEPLAVLRALHRMRFSPRAEALAPYLRHDREEVRRAAAEVLDDKVAIPVLEKLLSCATPEVRRTACESLCVRGSTSGAIRLLQAGEVSPYLNALRSPERWSRLSKTDIPVSLFHRPRFRLLKTLGVSTSPPVEPLEDPDYLFSYVDPRKDLGMMRLTDALVCTWDGPYTFVLEGDTLRVVTREEALRFWREWLSQKK